ncbi:Dolichyl-phosphate-mannose-protein mannosyltransferase [uncultured archaeon]|nr:Dolichyl-phosphate-mannose-protein mannosyltransferase [uncultured archaeon]
MTSTKKHAKQEASGIKEEKPPSKESSSHKLLVPVALFLLAFIIRYATINGGLYHTDSVIGVTAAEATYATHEMHYMHGTGYPGEVIIYVVFYAIHRALTGASSAEFAANFASVVFGSLCIPAFYYFIKELFGDKKTAAYAALLLTFLPVQWAISTYAKSNGPSLFFMAAASTLALQAGKDKSWKKKAAIGLLIGGISVTRIDDLLYMAIVPLLYYRGRFPLALKQEGEIKRIRFTLPVGELIKDLGLLFLPALIIAFPLYYPFWSKVGLSYIQGISTENRWLGIYHEVTTPLSIHWLTISTTYLGYALALAGVYLLSKRDKYMTTVLAFWFLLVFDYQANLTSTTARRVAPAFYPLLALIAYAISNLPEYFRKQNPSWKWIPTAGALLLFIYLPVNQPFDPTITIPLLIALMVAAAIILPTTKSIVDLTQDTPSILTLIIITALFFNNTYPIEEFLHTYSGPK